MNIGKPLSLLLIVLIGVSCNTNNDWSPVLLEKNTSNVTIAFGSCAHSYDTLKIFEAINKENPEVWIWLGDIMYGDSHDMAILKEKYARQKAKPEYQELIHKSKIVGIWDDHDYGINDGGKNYSRKDESKELLLNFLDVAQNNPVRDRNGVYSSYDILLKEKKIKIILLDTRYFRDTLQADTMSTARYLPNPDGDILGEEQWHWLEETLISSEADMNIIGTGIQLIPEEQGYEKWANFPASRERLFRLIQTTKPSPTLFISGDRHIAELSRINFNELDYPVYDFTSSGLTHTWGMYREEPNKYRIDSLIVAKNYGILRIDLSNTKPVVDLEIRGEKNELLQSNKINY